MSANDPRGKVELVIEISGVDPVFVFGPEDRLLRTIEESFPDVKFHARGNQIELSGPKQSVGLAESRIRQIIKAVSSGSVVSPADLKRTEPDLLSQSILSSRGKSIRPKTEGQKAYVEAIDTNTIVFGIGPAGTGKTYLAMAKAVAACSPRPAGTVPTTSPV